MRFGTFWREVLIRFACALTYIREYAGANRGEGVEACQRATGNVPPAYWCMSFVYRCVRPMLGKLLLKSASCSEQRVYAHKHGALRTRAAFDAALKDDPMSVLAWVMLVIDTTATGDEGEQAAGLHGHAHHTGLVGAVRDSDDALVVTPPSGDGFVTTEGNAADPDAPASRDGNGAYKGRLRGNRAPQTFGLTKPRPYKPDTSTYEFIDPSALPAVA